MTALGVLSPSKNKEIRFCTLQCISLLLTLLSLWYLCQLSVNLNVWLIWIFYSPVMPENKTFIKVGAFALPLEQLPYSQLFSKAKVFPHLICIKHLSSSYSTSFSMIVLLSHSSKTITIKTSVKASPKAPLLAPWGFLTPYLCLLIQST